MARREPDLPVGAWLVTILAVVCALAYHAGCVDRPPTMTDEDAIRERAGDH